MMCEKAIIPYIKDTTTLTTIIRDSTALGSKDQAPMPVPNCTNNNTKESDDTPNLIPQDNDSGSDNNDGNQPPHLVHRNGNAHVIPFDTEDVIASRTRSHRYNIHDDITIIRNMTTNIEPPFNVTLGSDPFDDILEIDISTRGNHPTLGLQMDTHTW